MERSATYLILPIELILAIRHRIPGSVTLYHTQRMRHPVICLCLCPADRAEYQSLIANRSTRRELVLSARNVSVSVEGHDIWAGIKRRLLRKCETIWVHTTFRRLRSPVFKWVELFAAEPLIGNRLPGCVLRQPKFAMLQCAALPNSSVERLQATDRFSHFLRLPCRGVTVGFPPTAS